MVKAVKAISAMVEENDQVRITKVTQTFSKQVETLEEPLKEGPGAFMPNKVDKSGPSLATTMVESATREEEC